MRHVRAAQRMRMFLWLAAHEQLMTNANRFERGLATPPCFITCPSHEETMVHLLRDCLHAQDVCSKLVAQNKQERSFFLYLSCHSFILRTVW